MCVIDIYLTSFELKNFCFRLLGPKPSRTPGVHEQVTLSLFPSYTEPVAGACVDRSLLMVATAR